ncbi:hypothetical protein Cni_G20478 [Canna indica]|uniref:DUF4378 domain-containing protein n=1 Tax=Canna indica TaxID=4628 RepID=A0AAQ3QHT6_9LILI|nr:hypothetical protein Cni_G20478 [Canna indica]
MRGESSSSSSGLAIVERKEPQRRPGGCAGVFFQLFDWKKKHFSKKLLPSVTAAKRVLRKFGGHEKLPVTKHLLVPKENGEGFSAVKRSGSISSSSSSQHRLVNGVRAPGLVARLMGLETMPVVHHGNTRKALDSKCGDVENKASESKAIGCRKVVSRPQELRAGRLFKCHGKYNSEALQLDMNLEHQRKLSLLVKGQRASLKRKKTRLMEVATKILEPGLQSRSRAKFAITNVGVALDNAEGPDAQYLSNRTVGSCMSCGNLVEVLDLRSSGKSSQELDCRYINAAVDSVDGSSSSSSSFDIRERNNLERRVVQRSKKFTGTLPLEREDMNSSHIMTNNGRREAPLAVQTKPSVHNRSKKNAVSKLALKQNSLRQNQSPLVTEKFVFGSKDWSQRHSTRNSDAMHGAKKFAASHTSSDNRKLITCRDRTSQKNVMKLATSDSDKNKVLKRRHGSNYHTGSSQVHHGTFTKHRSCSKELTTHQASGPIDNNPKNWNRVRSGQPTEAELGNRSRKENSSSSPRFCSRAERKPRSSISCQKIVESSKCLKEVIASTALQEFVSDVADNESLSSQNEQYMLAKMQDDALFANLEENIADISYFKDNMHTEDDFPGISSLLILERMISSLSNRGLLSQKNGDNSECSRRPEHVQDDEKAGHLTPPSTLEVEDSSSSDNYYHPRLNFGTGTSCKFHIDKFPTNIGNKPNMNCSYSSETTPKKTRFSYPSDATSNAKSLLEKSLLSQSSTGKIQSMLDLLFQDATGAPRNALRSTPKCNASCMVVHEVSPPRQLLLDSILECLVSLYSYFYYTGCKPWFRFQMLLSENKLTELIEEEIMNWHYLDGKSLTEIIEHDIWNPKLGWPSFNVREFELSEQMGDGIFELLVDEVVLELLC